jgi:hypothetical protein
MSIQSDVISLNELRSEIKRRAKDLKDLRKQEKIIANRIVEYLKAKEQPGVKFQGNAIVVEDKEKYVTKKKKDSQNDCIEFLSQYNINNPEEVLKKLLEIKKGVPEKIQKIKIKKIKN